MTPSSSNQLSQLETKEEHQLGSLLGKSDTAVKHVSAGTLIEKSNHQSQILKSLGSNDHTPINLPIDSLDSLAQDPGNYQHLLNSMVARISEDVISGRANPTYRNEALALQFDENVINEDAIVSTKCPHSTKNAEKIAAPSRFCISLVDPLHFLGIVPTNQSGELLQACK